ncbi:MAG: App1 family protein [Candidatus Nanopelagicales bacterium]
MAKRESPADDEPTATSPTLEEFDAVSEDDPTIDPPRAADADEDDDEDSSITDSIGSGVGRVVRSEKTAGIVAGIEDRLAKFRRERKIGKGTLRATYVVAYRGYVGNGRAYTKLRVTEEPVVPQQAEILTDPEALRGNLRRFAALSFPGVDVTVSMAGAADRAETARHGYANATVPVSDLVPGWHDYEVRTEPVDPDEEPATARSQVLVPDPAAPYWVISDIDDTVLQTGLAEGLVAVKNTLFGQARTRRAVPGMATLYRAIEGGPAGGARAPFFYISTGPWNLYDMLTEFLRVRGFPAGPMFLTDWGPQERYISRSGTQHKRSSLRRLQALYPKTKFVLIGDSGQQDAYNYTDFAREFPESVAAIIIVDVGLSDKAEAMREHEQTVAGEVPFHSVTDAREAAVVLAGMGVIREDAVDAVAAAYERS